MKIKELLIYIISILLIISFGIWLFTNNNPYQRAIKRSMNYISKHTLDSGKFVYKTSLDSNAKINSERYNNLRHSGTLYAMYLCEKELNKKSLHKKRILASKYFMKTYIKPYKNDMYAVLSIGKEENKPDDFHAKLGGAGLALVSLSNLYPEKEINLKTLRGLAKFILFMQNPDGSFKSEYNVKTEQFVKDFESLYYPGEAALGLLYLYEADPQKEWLNGAKKYLLYLVSRNSQKYVFDHWTLLAVKKLLETKDNGLTEQQTKALKIYCSKISKIILKQQITDTKHRFYGAFNKNGYMGSIGTIMEGLSAEYYITDDPNFKNEIFNALRAGNGALIRFQVKSGELAGGIPKALYWKQSSNSNDRVIRIDNVQHVLSGWINFVNLK